MVKLKTRPDAPLNVSIDLFPKQADFVSCEAQRVALIAGVGSGKTRGGAVKAFLKAAKCPKSHGMVAAPNYPMLRRSTLQEILNVFSEGFIVNYNKQDKEIHCANGSLIFLGSCDDPDSLRGPTLTWYWLDEAAIAPYESFDILEGRLRQTGKTIDGVEWTRQGWITTTPKGYNWVYQEFAAKERDNFKRFHCSARENIFLPPDYIKRLEETYSHDPEFALQEIEGQFVVVGGKLFFVLDRLKVMMGDCRSPLEERLGHTKIWKRPDPKGKYVAGLDTCWGETGSYADAWILDWQTGEQVAEIHGRIKPDEMAYITCKLCREYNDAWLVAEANGEGKLAVDTLKELGYSYRMYTRNREDKEKLGFWTDDKTRPVLLGTLEEAVRHGHIRVYGKETIDEYMSFIRDEKGRPCAMAGAYADRVMASALAWWGRQSAHFDNEVDSVIKVGRFDETKNSRSYLADSIRRY